MPFFEIIIIILWRSLSKLDVHCTLLYNKGINMNNLEDIANKSPRINTREITLSTGVFGTS